MIRDGRPPGTADPMSGNTGAATGATTTTGAADTETSDSGLATVWAAAAVAVLTTVLVACLHLGAAFLARHRAESAADLADRHDFQIYIAGAARQLEGAQALVFHLLRVIETPTTRKPKPAMLDDWV